MSSTGLTGADRGTGHEMRGGGEEGGGNIPPWQSTRGARDSAPADLQPLLYSRNTQYALRALTFLAEQKKGTVWQTQAIAKAERIPAPSLAKVMKALARAGVVRASRGRTGGYALSADPRKVTLWDVMIQFNDQARLSACLLGLYDCSDVGACSLHRYWGKTRAGIERFSKRTRISDLVAARAGERKKGRT